MPSTASTSVIETGPYRATDGLRPAGRIRPAVGSRGRVEQRLAVAADLAVGMEVAMGTALVTGASAGIGAEFARQLAARGDNLVLVARRKDELDRLAQELVDAHGIDVEVLAADLVEPEGLDQVRRRVDDTAQPVDLLVNNAGFGSYGHFVELDRDRQLRMVRLNVEALVDLAHAAATAMSARGSGAILNIASTAGFQPDPNAAVYGATKAFVRSFSRALHHELRPSGVTVTVLSPGITATEFQEVGELDPRGITTKFMMDVEPVVRAGLRGVSRGRAEVLPGVFNRLSAPLMQRLPSGLAGAISGRTHEMWLPE